MAVYKFITTAELLQTEEWRPIKGLERTHSVSNIGRVRREHLPSLGHYAKILAQHYDEDSYLRVRINVKGQRKEFGVHRLVAFAFLETIPSKPEVNHKDGVKTNNHVSNLEFCTTQENITHAVKMGLRADSSQHWQKIYPERRRRGEQVYFAKMTEEKVIEARQRYAEGGITKKALSVHYRISNVAMGNLINRKTWTHI